MSEAGIPFDVCIIGGGAAGLFCAIGAAQRGRSVIVLEGSNKIGKKILMSGGGRCNFTNLHTTPDNFLSANLHFCKSALSRYTPSDFVSLVEAHGIAYHEKTLGQLFCDVSSKDIVAMLQRECDDHGVVIKTHSEIRAIQADKIFSISTSLGTFAATALVIATGGLSIPKMGASDFGYRVARQFGHTIVATRAGLVPFTFTGALHEMTQRLSGVSCPVAISCNAQTFREQLLFTHRGLSGPAALQISNYWQPGATLAINLLPDHDTHQWLRLMKSERGKSVLRSVLSEQLPRALTIELESLLWSDATDRPIQEFSDARLDEIANALQQWPLKPAATEGYRTAEVTLGGINTNEISSQTFESKRQENLFFIGEVLDVTGHLGGFNFQWAWASGWAAAQAV